MATIFSLDTQRSKRKDISAVSSTWRWGPTFVLLDSSVGCVSFPSWKSFFRNATLKRLQTKRSHRRPPRTWRNPMDRTLGRLPAWCSSLRPRSPTRPSWKVPSNELIDERKKACCSSFCRGIHHLLSCHPEAVVVGSCSSQCPRAESWEHGRQDRVGEQDPQCDSAL